MCSNLFHFYERNEGGVCVLFCAHYVVWEKKARRKDYGGKLKLRK